MILLLVFHVLYLFDKKKICKNRHGENEVHFYIKVGKKSTIKVHLSLYKVADNFTYRIMEVKKKGGVFSFRKKKVQNLTCG